MREADLRRAARVILKIQDELDPSLRIATPEGDIHLAITLSADPAERMAMLQRFETFMAWKSARAFTIATELHTPDAVWCAGIARGERTACLSRITRHPAPWTKANFGPVEWLPAASIDPAIIALLPTAPRPLTPKEVAALQPWFGIEGTFPAVHIPSGQVRGV